MVWQFIQPAYLAHLNNIQKGMRKASTKRRKISSDKTRPWYYSACAFNCQINYIKTKKYITGFSLVAFWNFIFRIKFIIQIKISSKRIVSTILSYTTMSLTYFKSLQTIDSCD